MLVYNVHNQKFSNGVLATTYDRIRFARFTGLKFFDFRALKATVSIWKTNGVFAINGGLFLSKNQKSSTNKVSAIL